MDEKNKKDAKYSTDNTIVLNDGDTALVFRKGEQSAELVIPHSDGDESAPTSTIIAVAVAIEVNRNPVWVQSVIDKNVMFSGVSIVSPETSNDDS